jgi:hypothetical protein
MLVAVTSLGGAPGVTTFAVALAARWPDPTRVVLMECDPSGGDLAVRFSLNSSPGVVSLAAAVRRQAGPVSLRAHAQRMPGGLPVVVAPVGAQQAHAAMEQLTAGAATATSLRQAADADDLVLILDCGRIGPDSAALSIVRAADATLVLACTHIDQLARVMACKDSIQGWPHPALLLAGTGYRCADATRELELPVLGRIPVDQPSAALLCGRPALWWLPGGPARSALGRCAQTVAETLQSSTPAGLRGVLRAVP